MYIHVVLSAEKVPCSEQVEKSKVEKPKSRNFENSSSRCTASCMWRGVMRERFLMHERFLMRERVLSRAAFPASSPDSATRYSNTAANYTGSAPPTRFAKFPDFSNRPTRDTRENSNEQEVPWLTAVAQNSDCDFLASAAAAKSPGTVNSCRSAPLTSLQCRKSSWRRWRHGRSQT